VRQPTDGEEFTSRLAEVRVKVDRSNALKRELEEEIAELEATVAAIVAYDEATAERMRLEERLMELEGRISNDGEQLLNFESQMEDLKERRENQRRRRKSTTGSRRSMMQTRGGGARQRRGTRR